MPIIRRKSVLRMMVRKSLSIAVVFLTLLTLSIPSLAASPRYANATDANAKLAFSGLNATCQLSIQGVSGTSNISASMTLLQRTASGAYLPIKSWPSESTNSSYLSVSKSYAVSSGYTYRLEVSATVTSNGTTEAVYLSSENTK